MKTDKSRKLPACHTCNIIRAELNEQAHNDIGNIGAPTRNEYSDIPSEAVITNHLQPKMFIRLPRKVMQRVRCSEYEDIHLASPPVDLRCWMWCACTLHLTLSGLGG